LSNFVDFRRQAELTTMSFSLQLRKQICEEVKLVEEATTVSVDLWKSSHY
jgi:hypothetical protein